jgi:LacI family transcriptional regulator
MKRIAIQLDLIGGYGRQVLRGLMRYAVLNGDWEFVMPHIYGPGGGQRTIRGSTHGALLMLHDRSMIRALRRSRVPFVNVAHTLTLDQLRRLNVPSVLPDDDRIGLLAFEYFRDLGFRSFAFCGHPQVGWSLARKGTFVSAVRAAGFPCAIIEAADQVPLRWVSTLPPRTAIFAANDRYAWHAVDACRLASIRVPEDVSVLGVDNDLLLVDLVKPMLSSIEPLAFQIGFAAGKMLDSLMNGRTRAGRIELLQPEGVIKRLSTDALMIEDEAVVAAVRFIRLNAADPIGVEDVVRHVLVSRRNIERRFLKRTGRSILQEIRRVRLERARELLHDTDMEMPLIARKCGFTSSARFSVVFHQLTGMTPSSFRKQSREA